MLTVKENNSFCFLKISVLRFLGIVIRCIANKEIFLLVKVTLSLRSTFSGNRARISCDVIDFALLPDLRILAGERFFVRCRVTSKSALLEKMQLCKKKKKKFSTEL